MLYFYSDDGFCHKLQYLNKHRIAPFARSVEHETVAYLQVLISLKIRTRTCVCQLKYDLRFGLKVFFQNYFKFAHSIYQLSITGIPQFQLFIISNPKRVDLKVLRVVGLGGSSNGLLTRQILRPNTHCLDISKLLTYASLTQ